ncbi:eL24 family ribosomal protein [Aeoliella mucimassa]|uniref:Archaeal TRASH domain protein n=1 Tax=Aeoliella mucimassa TaxID=2527972 RepID=A0A518AT79_9BACT|nr:hypothetical protein [Aeoliella mucimassa]QDU57921.1 Archaeal TRASH domain protein [Aeoliella mucimassa]
MVLRFTLSFVLLTLFGASAANAQQPSESPSPATHEMAPATDASHAGHEMAEEPKQALPGPHGGVVSQAGDFQFETLLESGGIHLFAYNAQGQPLDVQQVRGAATLQLKGDAKRYRYDLYPEVEQDKSAKSLSVSVDLSRVAGREGELTFQLAGLASSNRRPVSFSTPFVGPLSEAQKTAAAIAAQGICPVSGQQLGSMGEPIAVTEGEQTIYVCCAGCVNKVKADFATYLKKIEQKIVAAPATEADAEAIKLQKTCPVTEAPLGSMGSPIKVTGLDRDVYLCCQGCLKALEKSPEKYLAKLPPLPTPKPVVVLATKDDAAFVAAQKLCPVMDEPLDAMGGPYKTVVEGKVVYLCCPGCAKMLNAEPEKYLAKLKEQGITPPAAK